MDDRIEKQRAIVSMIGGPEIDETHIRYHVVVGLPRVPWGHRMLIIDKCHSQPEKVLFYVRRTSQNGVSRDALRNWLSTDLHEWEVKSQTSFVCCVCIFSSIIRSFVNNSHWSANYEDYKKSQR